MKSWMGSPVFRRIIPCLFLASLVLSGCGGEAEQLEPAAKRLTLERLYSLPRLIGSEPKDYSWSSDGARLAFLWNDEGTNFYDVWSISTENPVPVRLTRLPRMEGGEAGSGDVEAIRHSIRAEQDSGVTAVEWQPDGKWLIFRFRGDLYRLEPGKEPERLTETAATEASAQFSPDGRNLAFLRDGDLWLGSFSDRGLEQTRQITRSGSDAIRIESFQWSPDAGRLAVQERDERQVRLRGIPDYLAEETVLREIRRPLPGEPSASRRLGIVDAQSGRTVWLRFSDQPMDPIFTYQWSPDSRSLLVDTGNLYVTERRILSFAREGGDPRLLYREVEPRNTSAYWQASWAPDSRGIYFLSDRGWDYHIWYLESPEQEPMEITSGQWAVARFFVAAERDSIFFVANRGRPEERHIFRVGLQGGELEQISRRAGTHEPVFSPEGRYAAVRFSSDAVPPDLLLTRLEVEEENERKVTESPLPEFHEFNWVTPEYVRFPSRVDGAELTGRLSIPAGLDRSRRHPAILGSVYSNSVRNQWGGRQAHPTWGLDQFLLQEGYILLNVNFRGSWGHGREFRRGILLDYGGIDVEDLQSGAEYLHSLPYVDPDRTGIWGSSYGGLLTAMSLFRKPGLYKAGVAGAPATNVWHATTGEMWVMGPPQKSHEEYVDSSAFTHAGGLEDHLMIIHGMRDPIVFFKDSVVLLERLMLLGKAHKVEFVMVPDSGHGWDAEELYQTMFTFRKLVDHFQRYLGKGPS